MCALAATCCNASAGIDAENHDIKKTSDNQSEQKDKNWQQDNHVYSVPSHTEETKQKHPVDGVFLLIKLVD